MKNFPGVGDRFFVVFVSLNHHVDTLHRSDVSGKEANCSKVKILKFVEQTFALKVFRERFHYNRGSVLTVIQALTAYKKKTSKIKLRSAVNSHYVRFDKKVVVIIEARGQYLPLEKPNCGHFSPRSNLAMTGYA